jgi:hypothetical protein
MSVKWGILPILLSYPSFNYIPENLQRRIFKKVLNQQNYGEKKMNHSL